MGKKVFYSVPKGRVPGIYLTWKECENQVKGFSGAVFKKFSTREEAEQFYEQGYSKSEVGKTPKMREKGEEEYRGFSRIPEDQAVAYVDGSYDGEDGSFSYGVVLITSQGVEEYSRRFPPSEEGRMRNVAGELRGALKAISRSVELSKKALDLHYDYQGIESWAKGLWKRNNPWTEGYKNKVDDLSKHIEIRFIKVKAHSGDPGNERADELAKKAKIEGE